MGVPAFFRWLSKKYPSIVVQCDDGVKGEYHFDNLYLDMNGIIHPCTHPENKAPPETEEDMFVAVFEYIEMIMKIVKPKKVLYMAVDGVAPRAKMNQQRSRRFRASQESIEKIMEVEKIKGELREKGLTVKDKPKEAHFDSNVITPGTQFMVNLSDALRAWIDSKFSDDYVDKDNIWPKDLIVVLSDAFVPGEGEHKIMDYIRKQKPQPGYDPNLSHCLYGADADLIMLGLSTHELNFTILREEFKPNQPKPCDICGQLGHEMKDCLGTERLEDDPNILFPAETEFIYIRLNVLREYLQKESQAGAVPLDLERFVDDFVFLCFFVGNDFLPHLPSLEIREGAIDKLLGIYKGMMAKPFDGDAYMTKDGLVRLERVQLILDELGAKEDDIFKTRHDNDMRFKERRKRQKVQNQSHANFNSPWMRPEAVGAGQRPGQFNNARTEAFNLRKETMQDNMSAAQKLKAMLRGGSESESEPSTSSQTQPAEQQQQAAEVSEDATKALKRKIEDPQDSDDEPEDLVQLYSDGWKERYYYHKFDCSIVVNMSSMVAREYVLGLCWVLRYYYQGCPDWKWFYPFHYAPFASDFVNIADIKVEFDRDAQPFMPLEQLMGVFPAASCQNLPPSWQRLMLEPNSPIIDFYPNTFKIDLNGKRAAWMGVALLPFIDERRMFKALERVYPDLTDEERMKNSRGHHLIFTSRCNSSFSLFAKEVVESENSQNVKVTLNPSLFRGISGFIQKSDRYSDKYDNTYCVIFTDPDYQKDFVFPAVKLATAIPPPTVLRPEDFAKQQRPWQPTIGMNPSNQRGYVNDAGRRMLAHSGYGQGQRDNRGGHGNPSFYRPPSSSQYTPFYNAPQGGQRSQYNPRGRGNAGFQRGNNRNYNNDPWDRR